MGDCLAAQPPDYRGLGEPTPFTGLNQSSPFRQGSGQCGGSIWGWSTGPVTAAEFAAMKRALVEKREAKWRARAALTGGKCKACSTDLGEVLSSYDGASICSFKYALELVDNLFCLNCKDSISTYLRASECTSAEEERELVERRRKTCARLASAHDGSRKCTGCNMLSSKFVRSREAREAWYRGEHVIPLDTRHTESFFCPSCYNDARKNNVAQGSLEVQVAWVDGRVADLARPNNLATVTKRLAEQRRTGVGEKCFTCGVNLLGQRARGELHFSELEECRGKFQCTPCSRKVRVDYKKPAGDDWGEAQQRKALAEMRKWRRYDPEKVDSVDEEEDEEEEEEEEEE
ncbi:hypothetical protein LTR17_015400 [Elasticomyces elasticus]|nr:hypothetical protein LTR17_015400 [Elasticomyces elasticus]